jgi:uncharacterized protein YjbI with pentapeptide repeats
MDSQLRQFSAEELAKVIAAHLADPIRNRANLSYADLRGADLTALYLPYANFRGADLTGANISSTTLTMADVAGANFREVVARPDQVTGMQNWLLAFWEQSVLTALALPPDHNERVSTKNFSGCNLEGRDLSFCDLSSCNLQNAILRKANLGKNDLRQSKLAGANVYHASLEQVQVLPEQAKETNDWIHARWSPEVLPALQLLQHHNDLLVDQGQNFSGLGFSLRGRDLGGSDFRETILKGVDVTRADFRFATVPPETVLTTRNWLLARWPAEVLQTLGLPADHNDRVEQRNFENYDLQGRDLSGFDLVTVNLRGASLNYAIFANADLHDTILANSVLHNVDLSTARGLRAYQLLGTDLTGAILPPGIAESLKSPPGVDESSKNSRKLFVTMLIACLYCWLTILSTTDAAILLGSASLALPVVQTPIPVAAFFLAAPILILVLYIYLHFSLQSLWDSLATLPAIFPDGRPLHERAYPWFMNSLVRTRFPILKRDCPWLPRFQVFCARILGWWVVPISLLAFWLRFLVRHNWAFITFHILLISLAVWFASWFWAVALATLDGRPPVRLKWYKSLPQRRSLSTFFPAVVVGVFAVWGSADAFSGNPRSGLHGMPVMQKVMIAMGWSPFADLEGANLSAEPSNWPTEDLRVVKGGQLSGIKLRGVYAAGAFGVNANLRGADLSESTFALADLRGASLGLANLRGTDFYGADLRGADLFLVEVKDTQFEHANLQGAKLLLRGVGRTDFVKSRNWVLAYFEHPEEFNLPLDHSVRVGRKDFSDYDFKKLMSDNNLVIFPDLQKADFSSANLQRASLEDAMLENANLSGADLRGAIVRRAHLSLANLERADLRGVDLTDASGLTLTQIASAITDKTTRLPGYLRRQIAFGSARSAGTRSQPSSH